MKIKIPKSINILGFPISIQEVPEDFDLFIEKDKEKKKLIGKWSLPERKITLKQNEIMDVSLLHEITEARHSFQLEVLSEEAIHREAMFWLSIFNQLNPKIMEAKNDGKLFRKTRRKK